MSQRITIQISKKVATCVTDLPIVCGNSDYVVDFRFDEEWDNHQIKTARFKVNNEYTDIVFDGNECSIPIIREAKVIWIGVFAGDLSTSTPALVRCRPSILDGEEIPAPPSEDVYNQIMELLNQYIEQGGGSGEGGADGVSPTIDVTPIDNGYRVTITDVNGTESFDILNGKDGADGTPGKDGINGKDGVDGVNGKDGKDGIDGKDYILTEADKTEIANLAKADLEPILGDINTALEAIIARQTSVIGGIG